VVEEIEMREAQVVFVELEKQWEDEANRSFALMRELEAAENRLVSVFTDEWRDRGGDLKMMRLAYSHFRKRLLWAAGKRKKDRPYLGLSGFPTRR
jgi:nuclear transport factor 2 (NTF2) superfamily protein